MKMMTIIPLYIGYHRSIPVDLYLLLNGLDKDFEYSSRNRLIRQGLTDEKVDIIFKVTILFK